MADLTCQSVVQESLNNSPHALCALCSFSIISSLPLPTYSNSSHYLLLSGLCFCVSFPLFSFFYRLAFPSGKMANDTPVDAQPCVSVDASQLCLDASQTERLRELLYQPIMVVSNNIQAHSLHPICVVPATYIAGVYQALKDASIAVTDVRLEGSGATHCVAKDPVKYVSTRQWERGREGGTERPRDREAERQGGRD